MQEIQIAILSGLYLNLRNEKPSYTEPGVVTENMLKWINMDGFLFPQKNNNRGVLQYAPTE